MRWLGRIVLGCIVWSASPAVSTTATRICLHRAENNGLMNAIPSRVIVTQDAEEGSDRQVSIAGGERKCVDAGPGRWRVEARSKRPYDPAAKDENECRSNTLTVEVVDGRTVKIDISPRLRGSEYLCGWRVSKTARSRITRR
jgi:hypothetical protein